MKLFSFFCFIFLFFIFVPHSSLHAQISKRDSLKKLYRQAKNDSLRLKYLHAATQTYLVTDIDSFKILTDSLLALAQKFNNKKYIGIAYKLKGNYYSQIEKNDSARLFFKKALFKAQTVNDLETQAYIYDNLATSYMDFIADSAQYYFTKSLEINKQLNNHYGLFFNYYNLGVLTDNSDRPKKALQYYLKALDYADSLKNARFQGYVANQIGAIYGEYLQDTIQAKKYFKTALKAFTQINDLRGKSITYMNLATIDLKNDIHYLRKALYFIKKVKDVANTTVITFNLGKHYLEKKRLDSAQIFLNQSLKLAKQYGYRDLIAQNSRELGKLYTIKRNWKEATKHLQTSLEITRQDSMKALELETLYYLSDLEEEKGRYKNALTYYKKADSLENVMDSIFNREKIKEIESKYQVEKKERENLMLKKQQIEQQLLLSHETKRKRILLYSFLFSLIILFGIIYFYIKLNKKKKLIESLQMELHHRIKNNLGLIDVFLNQVKWNIKDATLIEKLNELKSRIASINEVHKQLYQEKNPSKVNLKNYIHKLAEQVEQSLGDKQINIEIDIPDNTNLDFRKTFPLGLIINEFLTNSFKYAFPEQKKGKIRIKLRKMGEKFQLEMQDNGQGFPENFNPEKNNSFGLRIMKSLAKQIGGIFKIENNHGVKASVTFTL